MLKKSFIIDRLEDVYIVLEQGTISQKAVALYSQFDVFLYNIDVITIAPIPLIKINNAIFLVIMGSLSGIDLYGKYKNKYRILEISPRFNEAVEKTYYFYSLFPTIQKRFGLPLDNGNIIIGNFVTACVFGVIFGVRLSNPMELPIVAPDKILIPDTLLKKLAIHIKNFISVYGFTQYFGSTFLYDMAPTPNDDTLNNIAIVAGLTYAIGQYLLLYHPRYQRLLFGTLSSITITSWSVSMVLSMYSYLPTMQYPDNYDGDYNYTAVYDPISISLTTIVSLFILIMHFRKILEKIARYTQLHPDSSDDSITLPSSTESSPELESQKRDQSLIHSQIPSKGQCLAFFGTPCQLKNGKPAITATPLETLPEELDEEVSYSPKENFAWC